jgi:hypothetical protein
MKADHGSNKNRSARRDEREQGRGVDVGSPRGYRSSRTCDTEVRFDQQQRQK